MPETTKSTGKSDDSNRHQRAQARWAILRNALLHKARETATTATSDGENFSIHRFGGYEFIKRQIVQDTQQLRSNLKLLEVDPDDDSSSLESTVELIFLRLLALACLPSSTRFSLQIIGGFTTEDRVRILASLKERCANIFEIKQLNDSFCLDVVQIRGPKSTSYQCCRYALDEKCSIVTREPKQTHLSLQDLVSHRTVKVDNTGNICVWDSEKTLSYFLYNENTFGSMVDKPENTTKILELGTGMCGLSALALGLRLAQQQRTACDQKIQVILTDGHADGVKNNKINQHLTKAYSHGCNYYDRLEITIKELLWDTQLSESSKLVVDICLVSDCTHFQNYHAALAITIARSLRVGGRAIMCQPQRGGSLDNFLELISSLDDRIFEITKWDNPELENQHLKSAKDFEGTYDEQVHRPSILLLSKLRPLAQEDCTFLEQRQQNRKSKDQK